MLVVLKRKEKRQAWRRDGFMFVVLGEERIMTKHSGDRLCT